MATKTISISEDAYEALKSRKEKNESFSDVIRRTVGSKKITDFMGILSEKSAAGLEKSIKEGRKRSVRRYQ